MARSLKKMLEVPAIQFTNHQSLIINLKYERKKQELA